MTHDLIKQLYTENMSTGMNKILMGIKKNYCLELNWHVFINWWFVLTNQTNNDWNILRAG